ncbi:glycoside hydrolase [Spirochaetia bacterium]|nr:glycoside hydrolase [Spirochaetia bacterium]
MPLKYKFALFFILFSCLSCFVFAQNNDVETLINYANTFLGTPYKAGGTTRKGMDCSGFLFTTVQDSLHIKFPRTASDMFNKCARIKEGPVMRGDLVFFYTAGKKISHVGIYLGDGNFIHSASDGPKKGVIISNLSESYWSRTYGGAGRFLEHSDVEFELNGAF